jgi:polyisoprenoid-binding protein YceI
MTTNTTPIRTGSWPLDAIHSAIGFTIKHAGVNVFRGGFKNPHGALHVADDGVLALTGSAGVADLEVNSDELKAHLLSPDFFDAGAHPEITFASDPFPAPEDGDLRVTGTLTIHGTSRAVEATGTITTGAIDLYGNSRIGVTLETTIDRRDFGITWNADLPSGQPALADEVAIVVNLAFARAQD